jgi:hypothetical protein
MELQLSAGSRGRRGGMWEESDDNTTLLRGVIGKKQDWKGGGEICLCQIDFSWLHNNWTWSQSSGLNTPSGKACSTAGNASATGSITKRLLSIVSCSTRLWAGDANKNTAVISRLIYENTQWTERECEVAHSFNWLWKGSSGWRYEHRNVPLGSITGGEFLDQMSDCQILKKDSAPCSYILFQEECYIGHPVTWLPSQYTHNYSASKTSRCISLQNTSPTQME